MAHAEARGPDLDQAAPRLRANRAELGARLRMRRACGESEVGAPALARDGGMLVPSEEFFNDALGNFALNSSNGQKSLSTKIVSPLVLAAEDARLQSLAQQCATLDERLAHAADPFERRLASENRRGRQVSPGESELGSLGWGVWPGSFAWGVSPAESLLGVADGEDVGAEEGRGQSRRGEPPR